MLAPAEIVIGSHPAESELYLLLALVNSVKKRVMRHRPGSHRCSLPVSVLFSLFRDLLHFSSECKGLYITSHCGILSMGIETLANSTQKT
jgi:hypothetical protein